MTESKYKERGLDEYGYQAPPVFELLLVQGNAKHREAVVVGVEKIRAYADDGSMIN